jgi:hypothetical protein
MDIIEQAVAQLEMLIERAKTSGGAHAEAMLMLAQSVLLETVLESYKTESVSEDRDDDGTLTPFKH